MPEQKHKAVFLDRDGTLSVEVGYIDNVKDFKLYSETPDALKRLAEAGYKLVVLTNQSGVARGYFPESRVVEINEFMTRRLESFGISLDGIYYCPFYKDGKIEEYAKEDPCRKPDTGMIMRAVDEIGINLASSMIVGDSTADINCGKNAGIRSVLVLTGHGEKTYKIMKTMEKDEQPDHISKNIGEAVTWILENE